MEEILECPIDPGGTGRHQPLALGEGHNHSQGKGSHLQATCLQWTWVSPGSHFAVTFAGLAVPGQDPWLSKPWRQQNMGFAPDTPRASLQVLPPNCPFSWLFSLPTFSSLHRPPHLCLLPLVRVQPPRASSNHPQPEDTHGSVLGALRRWGTTRTRIHSRSVVSEGGDRDARLPCWIWGQARRAKRARVPQGVLCARRWQLSLEGGSAVPEAISQGAGVRACPGAKRSRFHAAPWPETPATWHAAPSLQPAAVPPSPPCTAGTPLAAAERPGEQISGSTRVHTRQQSSHSAECCMTDGNMQRDTGSVRQTNSPT